MLSPLKPTIFKQDTKFEGEPVCILDLKAIEIDDLVVVMKNCFHIYHYDCMVRRYEEDKIYKCLICNPENPQPNRT